MHGSDINLPNAIIVDIDGTVALRDPNGRRAYDWHRVLEDEPNQAVIDVVTILQIAGYHTVFLSGRMEQCRADTTLWLQRNHLIGSHLEPGHQAWRSWDLYMRADGDNRADELVKDQIFQERIQPNWNVLCVFDDRDKVVRMWRKKHELTVFQVAYGDF